VCPHFYQPQYEYKSVFRYNDHLRDVSNLDDGHQFLHSLSPPTPHVTKLVTPVDYVTNDVAASGSVAQADPLLCQLLQEVHHQRADGTNNNGLVLA
jgi:hypothetical protein